MIITTVHWYKFNIDFTNKTWEPRYKTCDSGDFNGTSLVLSLR